jgi:aminomuconate-semialdehyde/2-hydroxymuconate-6-semialdehyde dehydrogenase
MRLHVIGQQGRHARLNADSSLRRCPHAVQVYFFTARTLNMKEIKNFINGEYVTNVSGKTYEKRNPVDNSLIGMVYEAGQPEVDAAVAAAKAALKGPWGKLSVVERCNLLDAVANEINRRFDDFLQAEIADTGKPNHLASHVDIPRGAANFKMFADTIKTA